MTKAKKPTKNGPKPPKTGATAVRSRAWSPFMFLDPAASFPGWRFGVLRRKYQGLANDLEEFVRYKLHPVDAPKPGAKWRPTATRSEVLLPGGGVPDHLLDPQTLVTAYKAQLLDWQTSLLVVITIKPKVATLNEAWEAARAFARHSFCSPRRGLPVILVQHAPFLAGVAGSPPHLHLMAFTRRLLPGSGLFGAIDKEVSSDAGQIPLYEEYLSLTG